MKTLLIVILILSNSALASNSGITEADEYLQKSIALSNYFKDIGKSTKGIPGIDFFTVGADGDCNYSSIQAAIDDYAQTPFANIEIRIATNKTYFENITINNLTLSLIGGYSDCSIAAASGAPSNNQALINASNNGTVITIQGTTQRRTIVIKNINMINGQSSGAGGGLLSNASDVALLLDNADIRNSVAGFGGGIAILGGNTDLVIRDSLLFGNVADYGGGIYCSGVMSSVNVTNQSGIITNFANSPLVVAPNGQGGGAYINGCYFAIFSGSDSINSFTGMDFNSSENSGGAIYAENATIRIHGHQSCGTIGSLGCLGDDTNPVNFRGNQSSFGDGSVLYAKNSDVKVNATWIDGNAGNSLFYLEQSSFTIERFLQECWASSNCNLIENNTGTVLKGLNNDGIDISSVNITGNNSTVFDFNVGHPATPSSIRVESCMINNNGSNNNDYLFNFYGFFDAQFIHNTIADNQAANSIFRTDFNPNISILPLLEIQSSIVHNPSSIVYSFDELDFTLGGGQMHINVSASFVNEIDSLTSNILINDAIVYPDGERNSTLDPSFVDRNNGDYHLSSGSFAIDHIRTPDRATVLHPDIDFQTRGFNAPNVSGVPFFYYDVGADEVVNKPEIMFIDGFE